MHPESGGYCAECPRPRTVPGRAGSPPRDLSAAGLLAAVHASPHADTDSIIGAVRRDLPAVSHQAVYDVLRALTAAGLVRRIQPSGSVARYESRSRTTTTTSCAGPAVPLPTSTAPSARLLPDRVQRPGLLDRRGRGHLGHVSGLCHGTSTQLTRRTQEARPHDRERPTCLSTAAERKPCTPVLDPDPPPAQHQPGLVAQPAEPAGPPPALPASQSDG